MLALRLTGAERGLGLVVLLTALPLVLVLGWPLLLAALWLRRPALLAGALLVLAGQALVVLPAVRAQPLPLGALTAPRLRVVVLNLYVGNPDPAQAGRALLALAPDVLVVPELTPDGLAGLERAGVARDLPHRGVVLQDRFETVGLFSRLPLRDSQERALGPRRVVQATVRVGDRDVRVLPAHPLPPVPGWEPLWRGALEALAADVRATDLPVVLAGDLNADRDVGPFRGLLGTGLRDAADERGHGLAGTYPAAAPLLHLDHVLLRDGRGARLRALAHARVRVPGSDHLAVVVDVAVLPR